MIYLLETNIKRPPGEGGAGRGGRKQEEIT